jgi:hypothetical protein
MSSALDIFSCDSDFYLNTNVKTTVPAAVGRGCIQRGKKDQAEMGTKSDLK